MSANDEDDVTELKAIYKIPEMKHAFFIVSSLEDFSDNSMPSQQSKIGMECFERILRSQYCSQPKEAQQWTLEVVSQSDFLGILERQNPRWRVLSNQSSCNNPESLELIAINLVKTNSSEKQLSFVDDDDVIEVFI